MENEYKGRLLREFEDLVEKTSRLAAYLRNVKEIGPKEQLMEKQINAMDEYRAILAHRILIEMGVKDE